MLKPGVTDADIENAFKEMYGGEFFIRLLGKGACPEIKNIRASNYVDIGWQTDARTGRVIVMSALDNLVKGAAGQAVQNMNLLFGLPESEGLELVPGTKVIPFSSQTKQGRDELWEVIDSFVLPQEETEEEDK